MTKKNSIILGCCIIAVLGLFGLNQAKAGGYVAVDAADIDTDLSNHFSTILTGGYAFNSIVSVEAKTMISSRDDNYRGVNVSIEQYYGLYLKGRIPITDSFSVTGNFGYSNIEGEASYMGYSESASDSGSSFGVGVSYSLLEAWTISAGYQEIVEDVDMITAGIQLNF